MRMLLLAVLTLSTVVMGAAAAQDAAPTYLLKDYMPQAEGAKWIMKTTNQQGAETTLTTTVGKPKEVDGQQAFPMLTTNADGQLMRGTLETVTDNAYYLFGAIRGQRNQQGDQPATESLYDPMVVFPARLAVGQKAEATTKIQMRDQPVETKMVLELAAVESVTVPKATFDDCLKLVYATGNGDRVMKRTVWVAKGIGIVKTEQPGFGQNPQPRVTELMEYVPAPPPPPAE
jgi:hypothetical protein